MKTSPKSSTFIIFYLIFSLLFLSVVSIFTLILSKHEKKASLYSSDSGIVVVIDAGHGGEDGGTVGVNGCYEKDINLSMAMKLKTYLSSMGVRCVLTRNSDTLLYDRNVNYEGRKKHLDMLARLEITNSYENAIFVSIHQNAFPQEKYKGLQIYYSESNDSSAEIAKSIEEQVKKALQPQNNRISKASGGNIYLLDNLQCPAILIECGFLSNKEECELLCTDGYQNKLCAVIATALSKKLTSNTSPS